MKVILASQSPYRKELLSRVIEHFECIPAHIDEAQYKKSIQDHHQLSQKLAYEKAKKVAEKYPDALVIGSDQVCSFEGEVLSKTGSREKSLEMLKKLNGKTHQLITSYSILFKEQSLSHTDVTTLTMKENCLDLLNKYNELDKAVDCAGSYKLEQRGIVLFKSIKTSDYTAIVGLPLLKLSLDLESLGVNIFS